MTTPSPRRWLRFSLRALLVVITLVCIWLAYEVNFVRTRQAKRKKAEAKGLTFRTAAEVAAANEAIAISVGSNLHQAELPVLATIPARRRWLGDEAIQTITFHPWYGQEEEDARPYLKYFPEATLEVGVTHMSPPAD
jgi:hypothetical protein